MVYTEIEGFEWDDKKARTNFEKHRIRFEDAIKAFDDPYALIDESLKRSVASESRAVLIGDADGHVVVVVVFTLRKRGKSLRVISARRASRKERKLYEETKRISF
ncbi:BrnT family toxin [Bdellovibrio bacteriovorus]|uniref:BrnT family toxin n=1 Tax=Bdellovibrio bacteriovorus TaxID=959 RepID=UPI003A80F6FF